MTWHEFSKTVAQQFATWVVGPLALTIIVILFQKVSRILETKRRHFKFQSANVKDQMIQHELIELRVLLGADRTYLTMLHNGTKYLDGSEDVKKSRTHEVVGPGVSYENQNYQDIRLSLMHEEMEMMKDNAEASYALKKDFKDSKFRRMLDAQGVYAVGRCPLLEGGNIIGFVGADFGNENKPANFEVICQYAGQIHEIINKHRDK